MIDASKIYICGLPRYLICKKEAPFIAVAEIKACYTLSLTRKIINEKLHDILQTMGERGTDSKLKTKQAYSQQFIWRVINIKPEQVVQKWLISMGK